MDDRRLVGMTNGARKRAARTATASAYNLRSSGSDCTAWAWNMGETDIPVYPHDRRAALRYFVECELADRAPADYAEARKRYRVGERLQICRWCKGGGGCKSIGAHLQWVNDRFRACDGSGVVRK